MWFLNPLHISFFINQKGYLLLSFPRGDSVMINITFLSSLRRELLDLFNIAFLHLHNWGGFWVVLGIRNNVYTVLGRVPARS